MVFLERIFYPLKKQLRQFPVIYNDLSYFLRMT